MKRNELFKKTGICFTALALSAMVSAAGPAASVYAADYYGGVGAGGTDSLTGGSIFDGPSDWSDSSAGGIMQEGAGEPLYEGSMFGNGSVPGIILAPGLAGPAQQETVQQEAAASAAPQNTDPALANDPALAPTDQPAAEVMPPTSSNTATTAPASEDGEKDPSGNKDGEGGSGEDEENSGTGSDTGESGEEGGKTTDPDDDDQGSGKTDPSTGDSAADDTASTADSAKDDTASTGDSKKDDSSSSGDSKKDDSSSTGDSKKDDSSSSGDSKKENSSSAGDSKKNDSSSTGDSKKDEASTGGSTKDDAAQAGTNTGSSRRRPSFFDNVPMPDNMDMDSGDSTNSGVPFVVPPSPVLPDISTNVPYAPGTTGVPAGQQVPAVDPFLPITAPLSQIDPTITTPVLAAQPYAAQSNMWGASLTGLETVLNPGELPGGYSQASGYNGSNEQLIASQNIVSGLSILNDGFRFYTVEKDLAVAPAPQAVYEDMDQGAREIGELSANDALYVLSEEKDNWLYVESGTVRGFVPAGQVLRGTDADTALSSLQVNTGQTGSAEPYMHFATELIPAGDNNAFAYRRCTTKSTVVDKQYAIADADTAILEGAQEGAREVGHLAPGGLCYVILQANDKWAYVESGNVRGFTQTAGLTTGNAAKKIVQRTGEATMTRAEQLVSPAENAALYYTLNSVQEGVPFNPIRTDLIQTAARCIGNPYKWGGNSLTNGCDCSGFVKQLYALYGYNLPRVADDQSRYGTQIPIGDAAPGDLIFFASNGYVYHVALYAGDGKTIEAFSEDRGIIATSIGNRDAVWATRILPD